MKWRTIAASDLHEISDTGLVRNRKTKNLLNGSIGGPGYRVVSLKASRPIFYVHRLVLEAFAGPCPAGLESRHLNGIKTDNRRSNLVWGTSAENSADAKEHNGAFGRPPTIPDIEVLAIRALCHARIPHPIIARHFDCSRSNIGYISRGDSRVDVTLDALIKRSRPC